jgi:hypothetical protein
MKKDQRQRKRPRGPSFDDFLKDEGIYGQLHERWATPEEPITSVQISLPGSKRARDLPFRSLRAAFVAK